MADEGQNGTAATDGVKETPEKRIGTGLAGPGRPRGVPNLPTRRQKERILLFLESEPYWVGLQARINAGQAISMEVLLHNMAFGKPTDTVKLEGLDRPPALLVFQGGRRDPLADREAEPRPPQGALAAGGEVAAREGVVLEPFDLEGDGES